MEIKGLVPSDVPCIFSPDEFFVFLPSSSNVKVFESPKAENRSAREHQPLFSI